MNSFIEKILENPIGQGLGIIAMIIAFLGLIQKDDKKTIKVFIFSNLFWMLHFYYMGVASAIATNIVGMARLFLSLKYKKNKRIFYGIIAATIVLGVLTYENQLSLLPIMGSCLSAYGYFFFERLRLRIFMFITSLLWITFNLFNGSIGGVANEIVFQVILIVTMYRMIKKEGERLYFVDKIFEILSRPNPKPDVGRFISIYDYIKMTRKGIKNKAKNFWNKTKSYYKKVNSVKIYLFRKDKKFIEIEN